MIEWAILISYYEISYIGPVTPVRSCPPPPDIVIPEPVNIPDSSGCRSSLCPVTVTHWDILNYLVAFSGFEYNMIVSGLLSLWLIRGTLHKVNLNLNLLIVHEEVTFLEVWKPVTIARSRVPIGLSFSSLISSYHGAQVRQGQYFSSSSCSLTLAMPTTSN